MAREGFGTCRVEINGKTYDRMLSMNLQVSTQDRTPKGTIVLSWSGVEHYTEHRLVAPDFLSGAQGKIWLDGQLAQAIRFDTRISKGSPKNYELTLNYRGMQSISVDSAAIHETGQWNNEKVPDIIKSVMPPGTNLIDQSGDTSPIDKMILAAGETIERFSDRVARVRGLTFYETPQGDWLLKKIRQAASTGGAEGLPRLAEQLSNLPTGSLTLGRDFTQWSVKHDIRPQYGENVTQAAGNATDENYGKQNEGVLTNIMKTLLAANPEGRQSRYLAPAPQDQASNDLLAEYGSDAANQMAVTVTLKMSTWSDNTGRLWALDDKWLVTIPIDRVNDTLTIKAIEFELTKDSRSATLVLVGVAGASYGDYSLYNVKTTTFIEEMGERSKEPQPIKPTTKSPEPVTT